MIVWPASCHQRGMSDDNSASTIAEALARAADVYAETMQNVEEILRDEEVEELDGD